MEMESKPGAFSTSLTWLQRLQSFTLKVEGLVKLMEGERTGPFNLGNPGEFTMLELANVVQDIIDPNAKIGF